MRGKVRKNMCAVSKNFEKLSMFAFIIVLTFSTLCEARNSRHFLDVLLNLRGCKEEKKQFKGKLKFNYLHT